MKQYFEINGQFKKYLPVFTIMLSLILLMSSSYALLRSSQIGEETYVMNVGVLEVTFLDSETNTLIVENMIPVKDEEGMQTDNELSFTVKNTGDYDARYNIYIEETSTNPEFKSVVRFISKKNDRTYNAPQTLSENYYIEEYGNLKVGETATYKVKLWLDEQADSTYMNKVFTARIVLETVQGNLPIYGEVLKTIENSTCNSSLVEDGVTYLSGTDKCIDFNYVWYSGKLWKITAINPDGSMKMVTKENITAMRFGENNFYTDKENNSQIYQWLNQDFLDTLNDYENIIVTNYEWNTTTSNSSSDSDISVKLPTSAADGATLVTAPVGLLNSYEYYLSYKNNVSAQSGLRYLANGDNWFFINKSDTSGANWITYSSGNAHCAQSKNYVDGIRPSIVLRSNVNFVKGSGTIDDPYIIDDGKVIDYNVTLLNTRNSGDYVSFNNEIYRIVQVGEKTKLVKNEYIKDENGNVITKKISTSSTYGGGTNDNYWDYYLNNTWLNSIDVKYRGMLTTDVYYLGGSSSIASNYKFAICKSPSSTLTTRECEKVTETWTGYVGLIRFGEMFSIQITETPNVSQCLITPVYDKSHVWYINWDDYGDTRDVTSEYYYGVAPTITLKTGVVITGGDGTLQKPFTLDLIKKVYEYNQDNNYYVFAAQDSGKYKIELWGAQGGTSGTTGGKGGYTSGVISLEEGENLYVYVGSQGARYAGGYNGGGTGGTGNGQWAHGGGGATDVRYFGSTIPSTSDLAWNSSLGLNSRIMVAAGGGGNGSGEDSPGGYGGGLTGESGYDGYNNNYGGLTGKGASQTSAGFAGSNSAYKGSFGIGSNFYDSTYGGAGGGGGYYGGGGSNRGHGGGGGGSSFISGYVGSVAITSSTNTSPKSGCTDGTSDINCSYHYSGKVFTNTVMKSGADTMPSPSRGTEVGHMGNGYARITYFYE